MGEGRNIEPRRGVAERPVLAEDHIASGTIVPDQIAEAVAIDVAGPRKNAAAANSERKRLADIVSEEDVCRHVVVVNFVLDIRDEIGVTVVVDVAGPGHTGCTDAAVVQGKLAVTEPAFGARDQHRPTAAIGVDPRVVPLPRQHVVVAVAVDVSHGGEAEAEPVSDRPLVLLAGATLDDEPVGRIESGKIDRSEAAGLAVDHEDPAGLFPPGAGRAHDHVGKAIPVDVTPARDAGSGSRRPGIGIPAVNYKAAGAEAGEVDVPAAGSAAEDHVGPSVAAVGTRCSEDNVAKPVAIDVAGKRKADDRPGTRHGKALGRRQRGKIDRCGHGCSLTKVARSLSRPRWLASENDHPRAHHLRTRPKAPFPVCSLASRGRTCP